MSAGTRMQDRVGRLLDNRNVYSTATLTPITVTEGAYGGYEAAIETEGTAVTIRCIPSDYFSSKFLEQMAGNFNAGNVRIIIKGSTTITKDYKITWKSETYNIEEIKPLVFNDVTVAYIVALSKETS